MEHFIKNLLYLVLMIAVLLFGLTVTIGSMIAYNRFVNTPKEPTQVNIKAKMPERTTSVSVAKNKDIEKLENDLENIERTISNLFNINEKEEE